MPRAAAADPFVNPERTPNPRRSSWEALRTGGVRPVHAAYVLGCVLTVLALPVAMLIFG